MSLSKELIKVMKGCAEGIGEYDRRSALGIADSWVRGSNIDVEKARYSETGIPLNRDALAASLIAVLGDTPRLECKTALAAARADLNAPYANDLGMLAWREKRATRGELK